MTSADRIDQVAERIVARLREIAGEPAPKSTALRRALGITISDWSKAVQRLRWQGKLEFGTLTLTASSRGVATVAGQAAAREDGAALAKDAPSATGGAARSQLDVPPVVPLGQQLAAEIDAFIFATPGMSKTRFGKQCLWGPAAVEEIRRAAVPTDLTIAKVRAFIAANGDAAALARVAEAFGEVRPRGPREGSAYRLPPEAREEDGPPSQNRMMMDKALEVATERREERDDRLLTAAVARVTRRPGETLASAVKREANGCGSRRRDARKLSGTVHDPLPIGQIDLSARCTHHPKARAIPGLAPGRWEALRELAAEAEVPLADMLDRVIGAGILCVREDLREDALEVAERNADAGDCLGQSSRKAA